MAYSVTLIPGDGIGPEVIGAAQRVLEATGVQFRWELAPAGAGVMAGEGTPLPAAVLASVRKNRVALKGPVTTPVGTGFRSVNVALRQELDLYACVRPCKTYPGAPSLYPGVDIVIVRENTEDLYAGIEMEKGSAGAERLSRLVTELTGKSIREGSGISLKPISEAGSRRIVRFAFDYARSHGRKKVTALHKANIMKFTDGLFLSVAREVAALYADIEFEDRIIDNMCMQLVRRPQQFDVVVAPNLYGDIVSDLAAGLVGGLGLAPGANIGGEAAIFEPTHGSAPKYAGQNKVNPLAAILSGVLLLRHLGEQDAAGRVEGAVAAVIAAGKQVTYDLRADAEAVTGGVTGTAQVADAVIAALGGG